MVLIIREGRDRRLQMKKGVAKRLLGNARAIVAGVFIATAALAGAAVEAVPYASRIRPDVVEVSKSGTHFASSFSRWGWRANEFVDMSGDLDEPRNREAVSTWIEQVNPRLVIMNACCPAYVHSCHPGASQSQVERRERVKRQKTDGIYQFIHRIVDGQVGCGDHILMDLPMRRDVHGKSFVEVICKHPKVQCVLSSHPLREKSKWATTCEHFANELGRVYGESVHRNPDESADMRQQRLYRAVCKGYTKYLKEVEPGRVRNMLRGVVCQQGSAESRKAATRALQSFDGMRKTLRRSSDNGMLCMHREKTWMMPRMTMMMMKK